MLIGFRLFPQHEDTIAIIFIIGIFTSYFPWFILSSGVTVKSANKPVPITVIKNEIEEIDSFDTPVTVEKKSDSKYILSWRYADSKWGHIMSKSGMTQSYRLIIKLNDVKKQATLISVHRKVRWKVGATNFKIYGRVFRGLSPNFEKGNSLGIRESFETARKKDYEFKASEIQTPVVNSLLANGWNVRFGLY